MKKMVVFFFTCLITTFAIAQAGRLKISFVGFNCNRETWDDILHMDGKGDEVFFTFGVSIADKTGSTKFNYDFRTGYYGDATGPFTNRISAGSCVDLFGQNRGGIKGGDTYRCNTIIGEYDVADGDMIVIQPTGWEYDPIADNSNAFFGTMKNMFANINQKLAPYMMTLHVLTGNIAGLINQTTNLGLSKVLKAGGDQGDLGKPGTRPIGMEKYGDFTPKFINVNTPNLVNTVNSNFGYGQGVVAVNYNEEEVGNSRDHGNYTILVKIEFTPKAIVPAPPPSANNSNTIATPINVSAPIRNTTISVNNNLPITTKLNGHWTGVQTSDDGNYKQNVSYDLTDAGEIMIKMPSGTVISKGTYSIVNNVFTATYRSSSSGSVFACKGSYDPATQKIVFTMGYDPKITGQGKLELSKE